MEMDIFLIRQLILLNVFSSSDLQQQDLKLFLFVGIVVNDTQNKADFLWSFGDVNFLLITTSHKHAITPEQMVFIRLKQEI